MSVSQEIKCFRLNNNRLGNNVLNVPTLPTLSFLFLALCVRGVLRGSTPVGRRLTVPKQEKCLWHLILYFSKSHCKPQQHLLNCLFLVLENPRKHKLLCAVKSHPFIPDGRFMHPNLCKSKFGTDTYLAQAWTVVRVGRSVKTVFKPIRKQLMYLICLPQSIVNYPESVMSGNMRQ